MDLEHELARRWGLALGEPYDPGAGGTARRATRADGSRVVLKIWVPYRELLQSADALTAWAGEGAVRLLERDDEVHAMLLERCEPGVPLSTVDPVTAMDVLVGLLPRLWVPAPGFRTLTEESAWFSEYLPRQWEGTGRPYDRRFLDAALELLQWLPATQGEHVLVNQDLHGDNVLAARREPWLLIDPQPLAGEREFQAAPIVRSSELGHSRSEVNWRLDRLCDELDLDRDRALGWTIAHTVAWTMGGDEPLPSHTDVVGWLLGPAPR